MDNPENILNIAEKNQYQTIDDLLKHSHPSSTYYTLLVIASFIITSGLLLDNGFIIIGGILVSPLLSPVLTVALALSVGELSPLKRVAILLGKTFIAVIAISFLLSLVFGHTQNIKLFDNTLRTAVLYFIVAISSGAAATFAFARKDISEILPGTALAVSLVPPLSLIGIWLSTFNFPFARYFLLIFLLNLFGIIIGSLIVFSLLKFYKAEEEILKEAV